MAERNTEVDEFDRSWIFYRSEANYVPFETYLDGTMQEACVDRRDTDQVELRVDIQSPGATVGRADDLMVVGAIDGDVMGSGPALNEAIEEATDTRRIGSHFNICKYAVGRAVVMSNVIAIGERAEDDLDGWSKEYFASPRRARNAYAAVVIGAAKVKEYLLETTSIGHDPDDYPSIIYVITNSAHAVPRMIQPTSDNGFYITNHTSVLGLDRQKAFRGEAPLTVTAYHDNLGADIAMVDGMYAEGVRRDRRVAARILRTAATRAAIAEDLLHIDVFARDDTLHFDVPNMK